MDVVDTKAIIIVEDDEAIARLIQEVLNDVSGWGAVTVGNGALALAVIEAVRADLLILDADLPGLSGLEVADLARQRPETAHLPLLFISAGDYAEAVAQRGAPFLRKPFDLDDLLAQVHTLLAPSSGDADASRSGQA